MAGRERRTWTEEKKQRAVALAKAGETNEYIAGIVGMSASAVWKVTCGCRGRTKPRKKSERIAVSHQNQYVKVSTSAESARAARILARELRDDAALKSGDITPVFFGDPPPGYSALDRRRR